MKVLTPAVSHAVRKRLQVAKRGLDRRAGEEVTKRLNALEVGGSEFSRILEVIASTKAAEKELCMLRRKRRQNVAMTTGEDEQHSSDFDQALETNLAELEHALSRSRAALSQAENAASDLIRLPVERLLFLHLHAARAVDQCLGSGLALDRPSEDVLCLAVLALALGLFRDPNCSGGAQ